MGRFDFLWGPRPVALASPHASAPRKSSTTGGSKPRCAHYGFAHYALREIAFARPLSFFGALASDDAQGFLAAIYKLIDEDCCQRKEPPDFTPADLKVHPGRIVNQPLVVIEMPPPRAMTEAYYVGVVMQADVEQDLPEHPQLRYFTLELAAINGRPDALLCEWTGETHLERGPCQGITRDDFVRAIMEAL